ncbi:unnamed protein product [Haemonchus placei]|uniref:Tetratricopeptide repeat protein n=1 Tax=Haemonchus placei TaxID=6290 RepID=A0A0N4XB90_HAEPC|nr:unnamed protein product [Haemonchus placei]
MKGTEACSRAASLAFGITQQRENLMNDNIEVSITHTTTIDWLELSETATKLLFRDKRSRLFLLDGSRQSSLLNFCTYVQWVPGSDTIVAQSGNSLHVWYNPALPDQVTTITIKGEIESVLRDAERTEVIVQEDNAKVAYELDNVQIDFGSALESGDLNRASAFLDHYKVDDAYSMWNKVAQMASEQKNFFVAQRCFAALNEYPRARAAFRNAEMAEVTAKEIGGDGTQHWKIRANAAQLMRNFKEAENIYLKNNAIEEAIEMYQLLQKWDEALSIAKAVNYPGFEQLKANYYRTLFDTGRDAKAAERAERLYLEANLQKEAIAMYIKNNRWADAYRRAERLYLEANLQKEAIAMYIKNNRWADAYRLSEEFLGKEETTALYEAKAEELEEQGRYADAEQVCF